MEPSGTVLELSRGEERGWGFLSESGLIGPARMIKTGRASLLVRRLGETKWHELPGDKFDRRPRSREQRLNPSSILRMGKRKRRPAKPAISPGYEIFTLWAQVLASELDPLTAAERASHLSFGNDFNDLMLGEATNLAEKLASHSYLHAGISLARLLLAVITGQGVGAATSRTAWVKCDLLEVARLYLVEIPDPDLLRTAHQAGNSALAWGRERSDNGVVEAATFRLGTLYLDPYSAKRNRATYWLQNATWLRRGMSALGMSAVDTSEDDLRAFMPLPVVALRTAESYLRQAVDARRGKYRGLALKALAQALATLRMLGEPVTLEDLDAVAREAVALLPDDLEEARLYVWQFLSADAKLGLTPPPIPDGPAAGQDDESAALVTAALAAAGHKPEVANALVVRHQEFLARRPDPDWVGHLQLELRVAILNTLLSAQRKQEAWPADAAEQAELRTQLMASAEPPSVRSALLLALAEQATATGVGPDEGLACVDAAKTVEPGCLHLSENAILYLRGRLWFDCAGDLIKDQEGQVNAILPVWAYASAANLFQRVGVATQAQEALAALIPLVPLLTREEYLTVCDYLLGATLGLGDRVDPEADHVVQTYYATLLGHGLSEGASYDFLALVGQVAKGARMASALAAGRRTGLLLPTGLQAQLDRADAEEAGLLLPPASEGRLIAEQEDWLLTSYADTVESLPSDTPLHRLRRRQRQLDQALNRLLAQPGRSVVRSLEGLQNLLDNKQMVLLMIPARWHTGSWGIQWLLITHTDAYTQFVDSCVPYGDLTVSLGGREVRGSHDSALIVALRQGLQEDPGPDVANDDVLRLLDGRRRLGDLWQRIEDLLSEGHDHLLVVPHGPGHYVPWHLLGEAGDPLAARCVVSVLPSLSLLAPRSFTDLAMYRLHANPPVSLGLSYTKVNSHGLGELPHAEEEAAEVAQVLGINPVLEERATVPAVLDALKSARYVHLSAHGRHNVDAPAFQKILLAGFPGLLPAHRLSTCDLRGLSLVTLSGCETALGRFDRADNLRGIPAALFLAGVHSIIGTLWQARSASAKTFFVVLYQSILGGRSVADAYRAAQAETRKIFPSYRDWGPFVLMGGLPEHYTEMEIQ